MRCERLAALARRINSTGGFRQTQTAGWGIHGRRGGAVEWNRYACRESRGSDRNPHGPRRRHFARRLGGAAGLPRHRARPAARPWPRPGPPVIVIVVRSLNPGSETLVLASIVAVRAARTVYLDRSNQQRAAGRCAAVRHRSMIDEPHRMDDADDRGLVDDAEVTAVEAAGGGPEHEQLSRAQPATALPARQRAARAIACTLPCSTVQGWMIHTG